MIYDCFPFFNELELLEIRVNELKKCKQPVTHVLIESKYTFTGKEKPFYYAENCERFSEYPILSVQLDKKINGTPWDRERFQRNTIATALKLLNPADDNIVIISDGDEVPNYEAVDFFCDKINFDFAALIMNKFGYYLNCLEKFQGWDRARIMKYGYLKNKSPEEVRNSGFEKIVLNGGWHWSWLGGVEKIIEKFNAFSHQELNISQYNDPEILTQKLHNGQALWSDNLNDKWEFIPMDDRYPKYLINNIEKFKHLIHENI